MFRSSLRFVLCLLCSLTLLPSVSVANDSYVFFRDKDRQGIEVDGQTRLRYKAIAEKIVGHTIKGRGIRGKTKVVLTTETGNTVKINVHKFAYYSTETSVAKEIIRKIKAGRHLMVKNCAITEAEGAPQFAGLFEHKEIRYQTDYLKYVCDDVIKGKTKARRAFYFLDDFTHTEGFSVTLRPLSPTDPEQTIIRKTRSAHLNAIEYREINWVNSKSVNEPTGLIGGEAQISMYDGSTKSASQVQKGDLILSYDLRGSEVVISRVEAVDKFELEVQETLFSALGSQMTGGPQAPVYVSTEEDIHGALNEHQQFSLLKNIKRAMGLITLSGPKQSGVYSDTVKKVEVNEGNQEGFSIRVEPIMSAEGEGQKLGAGFFNYFANGILVHN